MQFEASKLDLRPFALKEDPSRGGSCAFDAIDELFGDAHFDRGAAAFDVDACPLAGGGVDVLRAAELEDVFPRRALSTPVEPAPGLDLARRAAGLKGRPSRRRRASRRRSCGSTSG